MVIKGTKKSPKENLSQLHNPCSNARTQLSDAKVLGERESACAHNNKAYWVPLGDHVGTIVAAESILGQKMTRTQSAWEHGKDGAWKREVAQN